MRRSRPIKNENPTEEHFMVSFNEINNKIRDNISEKLQSDEKKRRLKFF